VGYLAQEPVLDEARSVHDNIMDGLREKTALLLEMTLSLSLSLSPPPPLWPWLLPLS
jgi:hypothetical protein